MWLTRSDASYGTSIRPDVRQLEVVRLPRSCITWHTEHVAEFVPRAHNEQECVTRCGCLKDTTYVSLTRHPLYPRPLDWGRSPMQMSLWRQRSRAHRRTVLRVRCRSSASHTSLGLRYATRHPSVLTSSLTELGEVGGRLSASASLGRSKAGSLYLDAAMSRL